MANSISSFRELSEVFVNQYICSARHKQNISVLQNIKMQESEPLRDFVKRFGQAVLQVEGYSMDAILQVFKRNLNPASTFFQSLAKKPPASMDELFRRADKYAMLEDDLRAASQQIMVTNNPARGNQSGGKNRSGSKSSGQESSSRKQRPPLKLTPLNITYEQLLPILKDLPDFRQARPMIAPPELRDRKRHCAYHNEHGHTTEQCKSLQIYVESLIKNGQLTRYIKASEDQSKRPSDAKTASTEEVRPVINVIHGGPADDKHQSKRKRRKIISVAAAKERVFAIHGTFTSSSLRPIDGPIIFPPVDPQKVITPHDDALILTLGIAGFDVRRVLVDPGSSADLLEVSVFQQMGYSSSMMENPGRVLSGFNGSTTVSLGDIVLPVRAGPVSLNINFSVVEDLSPYNVIMGRVWLHTMKAIPSTYHQMISYLTESGQVDLHSSQLAARQCYQITVANKRADSASDEERSSPSRTK